MSNEIDISKNKNDIPGMFNGSVLGLIIRLGVPICIGGIIQLVYNITDLIWLSFIDKNDPSIVGGAGLIFPVVFLVMGFSNGIIVGVSSLVSRAIGEQNDKVLTTVIESAIVIAVILSLFFTIISYLFSKPIVGILSANEAPDFFLHGHEYLIYIVPAATFLFLSSVLFGILQGEGLMKIVMLGMIVGTVLNIILDPFFIFTLRMNVKGAALATSIAQGVSFFFLLSMSITAKKRTRIELKWKMNNIDFNIIKNIFKVGFPQTLQQILLSISFIVYNWVIISIDKLAMTALVYYSRFESIIYIPIISISIATTTIVGQNAGRGNIKRIRTIWWTAIKTSSITTLIIAVALCIFAPFIFPQLLNVEHVIKIAVRMAQILPFFLICAAVFINSRSAFIAIGHSGPALIITLLYQFLIIILILLFVFIFKLKLVGFFASIILGNCIGAAIAFIWSITTFNQLENGTLKVLKSDA